jgi:phage terminase large subunit GpA-like protein
MLDAPFASARMVRRATADIVRAPRRVAPSEAAARFLNTDRGRWDPVLTPYLVEPLDRLAGREYQGVVFAGPARTGKTMALVLGGITYVVTCMPSDMLVVQMSQDAARDFSRTDLDRAIRHSPELAARMSPRARDDNTFDKFFRSGMMLKLGWPAVSQLSSKTLKVVMFTDYDRPTNRDDVDGEGPLWDLGAKRIETYMSRGKVLAESSPGEDYSDAHWRPRSPHEAPPARGILALYNRGTRARWYWPCQGCGFMFEAKPGLANFAMPEFEQLEDMVQSQDLMSLAAELGRVVCPDCGVLHDLEQRPAMNGGGKWVHDGQRIDRLGRIYGDRPRSQIASYWLGSAAAAYQRWDAVVLKYLQALQAYVRTGAEDELRATTNTDQGAPYLPRAIAARRSAEQLMERSKAEDWPEGQVPAGVRFLVAAVDVQAHRFVVQVFGFGVGLEVWLLDRFSITASRRAEGKRFAALEPAAYVEDWDILVDEVMEKRYPVMGTAVELSPRVTVCDSGGKAGVTERAYEAWRRFRVRNLGRRFALVKGDGRVNIPRVKKAWPDSRGGTARMAAARGDVPVWVLNTNVFKDAIAGDLAREKPGPGYVHLPPWLPAEVFDELTAEVRSDKGWKREKNEPNEAFDLHVYARAACVMLGAERINWNSPPAWAKPIEDREVEPAAAEPETAPKRKRAAPVRRNWVNQW